jgi:hypothetical protein
MYTLSTYATIYIAWPEVPHSHFALRARL